MKRRAERTDNHLVRDTFATRAVSLSTRKRRRVEETHMMLFNPNVSRYGKLCLFGCPDRNTPNRNGRGVRERSELKFEEERKSEDSPGRTIAKHSGGKSTCSSP